MIEVLNISVLALRKSAKSLFQAFVLILFFASIFILLGKQLYKGVLTQKCVLSHPPNISHNEYTVFVDNSSNWLEDKNGYYLCGNGTGARRCPGNYVCLQGAEIDSFYSSNFNFYGSSVITTSQLLTLHFWQELYQRMLLTVGSLHVTYFVFAFYTFLYLNGLILTIITRSYKVVVMELNASDKTATLVVQDNTSRCQRSKSIVKSPSCKSYELFVTQVRTVDRNATDNPETFHSTAQTVLQGTHSPAESQELGQKKSTARIDRLTSVATYFYQTRAKIQWYLISEFWECVFLALIGANALLMTLRRFDLGPQMETLLTVAYYVFAVQSLAEIVLKMLAFGPVRYFLNVWNRLDFVFVGSAVVELALRRKPGVLLVLRFFKLTRLLQKACCPICNYLASVTCKVISMYCHPGVVLIVFVTICIVSGMQMYGTEYFHSIGRLPDQEWPRWFFRDCYSSFLLVFCMLCGDWKQPMVNAIFFTSYASNLLMLIFVLFGNLVVMNLFPGLVYYTFYNKIATPFATVLDSSKGGAIGRIFHRFQGKDLSASEVAVDCDGKSDESKTERTVATSVSQEIINKNMGKDSISTRSTQKSLGLSRLNKQFEIIEDHPQEYMADCCPNLCYFCCSFCKPDKNPVLWQNWTNLRCWLYCVVETRLFRAIIGTIIIVSVVILIVERTYSEDYPVAVKIVQILEPTVIIVFILEMFLKWTAYGLQKYFKSPLGRLEFVIVLVYLADLLTIQFFDGQKNIFKSLRSFRLLSVIQLLSSYQEVPPLPMKRNNSVVGSDHASRESLLHLKRMECDHFLRGHCRQRQMTSQCIFSRDSVQTDWRRSTVYTPESTEKISMRRNSAKGEDPPVVETHNCLPTFCYSDSCCCYCCRCNEPGLIMNKWQTVREMATRVVNSRHFFIFTQFVIILSSLFLVADTLYILRLPIMNTISWYADRVFASLFVFLFMIRFLALGCKMYFSSMWCWLEFVVVVTSVLFVALDEAGIACIPLLRLCRIFYLLHVSKALGFNKQSQMLLKSLGAALPSYIIAILLCVFLWLVHAVIGVYLFGGMFQYCSLGSGANAEKIPIHRGSFPYNSRDSCAALNGTYSVSMVNFDNIGRSFVALLQVATLQDWLSLVTEIMDNCLPAENIKYQFLTGIYFPTFIMWSTFLTLNFFAGVTLYYLIHFKKDLKTKCTNETQKLYQAAVKKMKKVKLQKSVPEPMLPFQKLIYRMVHSDNFEIAGFVFIGLHMLLIALDMYDPYPSEMFALAMIELNVFFVTIFSVEAVLKLIALRQYFFIGLWSLFDAVVLALCIVGLLFSDNTFISPMLPAMFRILRFVKAPRYLRRHARSVLPLIATLYCSIPAALSICLLQFIVMTIYTVFGVYLFKDVKHLWDVSGELNFATFSQSMLLLFQLSTLSGWKDVLYSLEQGTMCTHDSDINSECYNWEIAVVYIVSYIILTYYIIVKTHLVIVMENYQRSMEELENILLLEDYQMFAEIWQKFDTNATGIIKFSKLPDLLDVLEDPLHFDRPNRFLIVSLNVPIYEGELVFYGDVMDALTRDFMASNGHVTELPQNLPTLMDKNGRMLKKISSSLWRQRQNHCAHLIQNAWKRYTGKLVHRSCPVFYSEVRLASHSEKVDTYLTSGDRFNSHASV